MNKNVIKSIIGGILLGTILFFTGPFIFIVLLLKFIFTPFGMGRIMMYQRFGRHPRQASVPFAMADNIRNMSDEEFVSFKEKMNNRFNSNYPSSCKY
ncbi:MAG: hypothetical protein IPL35_01180 [Sphingobacteriales bacterium]|nr:hypothetical protein [Sphingobacteriales bacterium]